MEKLIGDASMDSTRSFEGWEFCVPRGVLRRVARASTVLLLLVLSVTAGCTPTLQKMAGKPLVPEVNDQHRSEAWARARRNLQASTPKEYFPSPGEMLRRLDEVGRSVARAAGIPHTALRFQLDESAGLNAGVTKRGEVIVGSALLEALPTDDALAALLGHELAHFALGHHAEDELRDNVAAGVGIFAATIMIAANVMLAAHTGTLDPELLNNSVRLAYMLGEGGTSGAMLIGGFDRDQESAADYYGTQLAVTAGFDPEGAEQLHYVLVEHSYLRGEANGETGLLDTHPSDLDRLARATQLLPVFKTNAPMLRSTWGCTLELPIRCPDATCVPGWATCCGNGAFCALGQACVADDTEPIGFRCEPWGSEALRPKLAQRAEFLEIVETFNQELESRLTLVERLEASCSSSGRYCEEFNVQGRQLVIWFHATLLELVPSFRAFSPGDVEAVLAHREAERERRDDLLQRLRAIAGPRLDLPDL